MILQSVCFGLELEFLSLNFFAQISSTEVQPNPIRDAAARSVIFKWIRQRIWLVQITCLNVGLRIGSSLCNDNWSNSKVHAVHRALLQADRNVNRYLHEQVRCCLHWSSTRPLFKHKSSSYRLSAAMIRRLSIMWSNSTGIVEFCSSALQTLLDLGDCCASTN